jgi:hypothetical protein
LLVAILFLLCFLKQTETIRSEKSSQLADAHRQNSSRGSRSADHYCCGSPSEEVRQPGSPLISLESILLFDANPWQRLPLPFPAVPRSIGASGKFTLPFAARAMLDLSQN